MPGTSAPGRIIDGEIVVPAADGTTDFLQNELKGRSTKIVMVVFDLLYLNGYDLRKLPLVERKTLLKKTIEQIAHNHRPLLDPCQADKVCDRDNPLSEVRCQNGESIASPS